MMDLRQLKKEVEALSDSSQDIQLLKETWLASLQNEFFPHLPAQQQKVIREFLKTTRTLLEQVTVGQHISLRLRSQARLLMELKLCQLLQDHKKAQLLAKKLGTDELLRFSSTLQDIRSLRQAIIQLQQQEKIFTSQLEHHLPLENKISYHEMQKCLPWKSLQQRADQQERLTSILGKQYLSLAKQVGWGGGKVKWSEVRT